MLTLARRFTVTALIATAVAPALWAEVLAPDTVGCITRKSYDRYTKLSATSPDFAKKLFDNASCYTQKKPVEAAILSQVGEATKVELLNGSRIWVPTSALLESFPAETDAVAQ